MDLIRATNCIEEMRQNGTYRGHRIGKLREDISGMFLDYQGGEVVLFRDEVLSQDFIGLAPKQTGRITIESPLSQEDIDKQKERGSLLTTHRTIVHVPKGYVEEIYI